MLDHPPLREISAFSGFAAPNLVAGAPGVTVVERTGLGLATVTARKGQGEKLAGLVRDAYGIDLVDGPKVSGGAGAAFIGTGPGIWLAVKEDDGWRFARELAAALGEAAAVSDQSSGYGVLRVGGPRIRPTLAKGVPIDLHPSAFQPGDAAVTLASHVGIVLWQVDAAPTYDIAVFRSLSGSFWHWLSASAAEFGMAVA